VCFIHKKVSKAEGTKGQSKKIFLKLF